MSDDKSYYNRYSTSLKIAVKPGLVDSDNLAHLPISTRHNFRKSSFEDLVGKKYDGLLEKLYDVLTIIQSRSVQNVMKDAV